MSYTWENKVLDLRYPKKPPSPIAASNVFIETNARLLETQSVHAIFSTYGVDYYVSHLLFAHQKMERVR